MKTYVARRLLALVPVALVVATVGFTLIHLAPGDPASVIAGRSAPTDGFLGVAPDARILSLRQTSDAFQPVGSRTDPNDPNTTQTAGSLRSLARAVMHAANLGAQVINISEAACYKATRPINESGVGAAINYAVNVKGAIIIVAAGNTGQDCTQNPPPDAGVPADPRGWKQVQTIVSPTSAKAI